MSAGKVGERVAQSIKIAMWSGPRNISTALMRAFGARHDPRVVDEPFYGAYLAHSGADHPMRAECLAAQPNDWRDVVAALIGDVPNDRAIVYQKHMTHHMLPDFGRDWMMEDQFKFFHTCLSTASRLQALR